jgi:hypothetical protein
MQVQSDLKHRDFPFKCFSKDGKPYIRVEYRGEEKEIVGDLSFKFAVCDKCLI